MLRYSRDFEKQADLMGAQIMARAGYDPRALAHMFETIEAQMGAAGGETPQWLSDHPNPGNRTQYITKEAEALTIASAADMSQFVPIKTAFASLPPAKTMADLAKAKSEPKGQPTHLVGTPGEPLARPSNSFQPVKGGNVFQASVPSDWTLIPAKGSIKAVPQNGYGELNGQAVFSCGVEFGIAKANTRDLQGATQTFLNAVAQNNPDLRLAGEPRTLQISQRSAIATPLVNPSPLGGQERIVFYTTFLADGGTLFYFFSVVPERDADAFQDAFQHIGQSIRLTDAR
jgi:hypothetical protein